VLLGNENKGWAGRARRGRETGVSGAAGDKEEGREAAELAFMLKAVSLGFGVAKPWGDSEQYDFILDTGTRLSRVQVKSTSAIQNGAYCVNAQRHANGKYIAYRTGEIDFLIAQIVPEDSWYVIPLQAILPRRHLRIYPEDETTSSALPKISGGVALDWVKHPDGSPLPFRGARRSLNSPMSSLRELHFARRSYIPDHFEHLNGTLGTRDQDGLPGRSTS
jgi:hypothetical protein